VDAAPIEALLPQTQCTRCGYEGCRPYSEAIARGEAGINQCPPGGARTIEALAALLGREPPSSTRSAALAAPAACRPAPSMRSWARAA
jgi:RnfABCDGE-type electron transport complex B subunit